MHGCEGETRLLHAQRSHHHVCGVERVNKVRRKGRSLSTPHNTQHRHIHVKQSSPQRICTHRYFVYVCMCWGVGVGGGGGPLRVTLRTCFCDDTGNASLHTASTTVCKTVFTWCILGFLYGCMTGRPKGVTHDIAWPCDGSKPHR